ncbi:MAG: N-acetylmuramoyl-L-alanine amidase [Planctomycetes bacterium]|nr:N-acetylmuramoyl-L-alanine amidase [Planctomycetota bacterium]MCB9889986.1 N-acetylmuramoyl-L-alanine amidase [Planctomycetota bacterium]
MIRIRPTSIAAAMGMMVLCGCVAPPYSAPVPARLAPRVSVASITAPAVDGERELSRLDTASGDPACLLRRAYVLLSCGRGTQAVHTANRVLYRTPRPTPETQSLALYVRALAFQRTGDTGRAAEDLRKARTLARDPALRDRCGTELGEVAATREPTGEPDGAPAADFAVLSRSRWSAKRPVVPRMQPMRGVGRVTLHHSATLSRNVEARVVAAQIRGIQQFHMNQNAWGDIGYHFLIDPAGRVWEGRELRYQGAHAGGANNERNIGICLLGNFTGRGQQPTSRQISSMEQLVLWLRREFSIPAGGVLTHNEIKGQTSCPGARLQSEINRMRARHARATAEFGAPGGSR